MRTCFRQQEKSAKEVLERCGIQLSALWNIHDVTQSELSRMRPTERMVYMMNKVFEVVRDRKVHFCIIYFATF